MINRHVHLPPAPLEPSPLDMRWPLGLPLDLQIEFKSYKGETVDLTGYNGQFVLFPRSRGGQHPYDMRVYDEVNGIVEVSIPGSDLTDPQGYRFELYSRVPSEVEGNPAIPVSMPVTGTIVTYGTAYSSTGPQSQVNIPVVQGPPGPAGIQGAPGPVGEPGEEGQRGTMWFSGVGDPTIEHVEDYIFGDMYLDTSNGAVWKWVGETWARI